MNKITRLSDVAYAMEPPRPDRTNRTGHDVAKLTTLQLTCQYVAEEAVRLRTILVSAPAEQREAEWAKDDLNRELKRLRALLAEIGEPK